MLNKHSHQSCIKHSSALKTQKPIDLLLFVWKYTLFFQRIVDFLLFTYCFSSVLFFPWPLTLSSCILFHTLSTIRFQTDSMAPYCERWRIWKPTWTSNGLCENCYLLFLMKLLKRIWTIDEAIVMEDKVTESKSALDELKTDRVCVSLHSEFDIYDMMIWYDIWYDMVYDMMIWYDMIWYDMMYDIWYKIWYDTIWYDMIWYIWYDMMWCDMIWYDVWYMI